MINNLNDMNDKLQNAFQYAELLSSERKYSKRIPNCPKDKIELWDEYRKEAVKIARTVNKDLVQGSYSLDTPVIDHKLSIYYGFIHNIPASIISHHSNLRYVSAKENNTKRSRCAFDASNSEGLSKETISTWGFNG